jgi:hypothetical protein
MTRRPAAADPAPPEPHRLWMAAQRLADGDDPALAAVMAGLHGELLARLIDGRDPGFAALCADCRRVRALSPEATEARLGRLALDAAERLLMAGNATVTLRFLRDDPAAKASRREAALIAANQNLLRMLHHMSWEELTELRAGAAPPAPPANDGGWRESG